MRVFRISVPVLIGLSTLALAGPDLVCSEINGAHSFGTSGEGIHSYSFGTTVCNIGDEAVGWNPDTNGHPVISQTLYKLKNHRITQIGIGFVVHATIPLQSDGCGLGCSPVPGFEMLGAGCSTDSSATANGAQELMGPRREINAQSGDFPYPFTSIGQTGDANYKRLQVPASEISDPDALYFVETQVISSFETTPESRDNNTSYRQVLFSPGSLSPTLTGPTYTEQPALNAWRDHGNGIGIPDPEVMISTRNFPDIDDTFVVGSRVTNLGGDLYDHWEFHYAILNMNGELGIRQLLVPNLFCSGPEPEVVTTEFHGPNYHDDLDDQIINTPWSVLVDKTPYGGVIWSTVTFDQNPNANAIRWGTMYSFSFEVENQFGASKGESVNIQLFGPDQTTNNLYWFQAWAPAHCDPFFCLADLAGNVDGTPDGALNFLDVSAFLVLFAAGDLSVDFAGNPDGSPDGVLNFIDVSAFLNAFGAGCP